MSAEFPFTRPDFDYAAKHMKQWKCRFASIHVFHQGSTAFASSSSEETIRVIRGACGDFDSLVHFSLECVDLIPEYSDDRSKPFKQIPPKSVTAEEIKAKIKLTGAAVLKQVQLYADANYGAGYLLDDDWNEILVTWHNQFDEFVAYYWNTTA